MYVCRHCLVEMTCTKTGLGVRFPVDHVYPGDEHTCPNCFSSVIATTQNPVYDPNHLVNTVDMKVENGSF